MLRIFMAAFLALAALAARAQPAPPPVSYNVVSLQAEAQREVENDLMSALLYVEQSEPDSARLAQALNGAINSGLETAKQFKSVRTRSGGYQTYPIYDNRRRLMEWRGRAEIAQKALGGRGYKIRQLNVGTGFGGPQPLAFEARAAAASAVAPPQLEGGSTRVTVTASGSVEVE
jgi:predicted secreted protein